MHAVSLLCSPSAEYYKVSSSQSMTVAYNFEIWELTKEGATGWLSKDGSKG